MSYETVQALVLTSFFLAIGLLLAVFALAVLRRGERVEHQRIDNEFAWVLARSDGWKKDWQGRRTDTWINPSEPGRHRVDTGTETAVMDAVPVPSRVVGTAHVDREIWEELDVMSAVLRGDMLPVRTRVRS